MILARGGASALSLLRSSDAGYGSESPKASDELVHYTRPCVLIFAGYEAISESAMGLACIVIF